MTFFAFGVNHETAPVRIREQISMSVSRVREVYRSLEPSACEAVIISTCNRTEVYLYGRREDVELLCGRIADVAEREWPSGFDFLYEDEAAVAHLLQVVSGLRSLVLGDGQIFAQMKEAYRVAVDEDAVGTALHRLMHTAFRTAKRVIAETLLTSGNASVAGAAAAVARDFFYRHDGGGLEGKNVLILGAGQMGALAIEAVVESKPGRVMVCNRTSTRADRLAESDVVDVVEWERRHEAAGESDLIIVTTGAPEYVLCADELPPRTRPVLVIDISVPRNVQPELAALPGYDIIDLDALNRLLVDAERTRRDAVPAAESICNEHLEEFVSWTLHHQSMQPAIHSIAATFDEIRRLEIDRHAHRFSEIDREQLDRLTQSIMQKLLAVPIVRLKSADPKSVDFVQGVQLLRYLFSRPGCDDSAVHGEVDPQREELLRKLLAIDFTPGGTDDLLS